MNTNVDFEEHTVDKEKRQKKIESKKRDKVKSTGRKKMHSPKDNRNSAFRNNYKHYHKISQLIRVGFINLICIY